MILGLVRGNSPRVRLPLPGLTRPVGVELIVDTGFEGDSVLPPALLRRNELRLVEVMELEGRPLLGMLLLSTSHLHMEGNEGGEIIIEPL